VGFLLFSLLLPRYRSQKHSYRQSGIRPLFVGRTIPMYPSFLRRPVIFLDITLRIRAEGVLRPFLYLIESEGRPSLWPKR